MPDIDLAPSFTSDDTMPTAARHLWTGQLAIICQHEAAGREQADMVAIHETRKAIRRLRTSFKLFAPYFLPGSLEPYRRCLRRTMRRLARSRDLAVFLSKLDQYAGSPERTEAEHSGLAALAAAVAAMRAVADERAMKALAGTKFQRCRADFTHFIAVESGAGPTLEYSLTTLNVPPIVRLQLPPIVYGRLAAVRAYEGRIVGATLTELHGLRIQFKELRYALDFFAPVLGPTLTPLLAFLDQIQDCLGDLNDARVALELLDELAAAYSPPELAAGAAAYRPWQLAQIDQLRAGFDRLWAEFSAPEWRRQLALAVAIL